MLIYMLKRVLGVNLRAVEYLVRCVFIVYSKLLGLGAAGASC